MKLQTCQSLSKEGTLTVLCTKHTMTTEIISHSCNVVMPLATCMHSKQLSSLSGHAFITIFKLPFPHTICENVTFIYNNNNTIVNITFCPSVASFFNFTKCLLFLCILALLCRKKRLWIIADAKRKSHWSSEGNHQWRL